MVCGFEGQLNCPRYRPLPSLLSFPISAPVEATKTCNVAAELELVAVTLSRRSPAAYKACVIETVSVVADDGDTVRTAVRVAPPNVAEIVVELEAVTAFEVTLKVALVAPAGTVTLTGTVAAAVLLLESVTEAPADGAADVSVTVAVDEAPPVTLVGLRLSAETDGPVAKGFTVSVADFVTPAPEAVIVTVVGTVGFDVVMKKPPPPANCGTVTNGGTLATDGVLLESMIWTSPFAGEARVTVPEEPFVPSVVVGEIVIDPGGTCGVNVICAWTAPPFQLAVTATVVVVDTALVGTLKETDASPARAVAVAGGLTADELLVRLTTAPPGGARPFSMTIPPAAAPPVIVPGESQRLFSDGGWTVIEIAAEDEPSVAVTVTGVAAVTCPNVNPNGATAKPAGSPPPGRNGAAPWLLLVRLTTAPPAGAARLSWTWPPSSSPLNAVGARVRVTPVTVAGPVLTVNVAVFDHAVTAEVVGLLFPWNERTRQNFVPAVSDSTV